MKRFGIILAGIAMAVSTPCVFAQSLNWEGQTGVFATPLAYTAASPGDGFGKPAVGYHFLYLGNVIGSFHSVSITEGVAGRVEFGYTRTMLQSGGDATLSPLWNGGFNIAHAKVNVEKENAGKNNWLPAISGGFVVRAPVGNVSGQLASTNYTTADIYFVATKTITQTKGLPIVLSGGYKATNASIYGLTGAAPGYTGRAFGTAAFVVTGPSKSAFIFATEVAQQPQQIRNLAAADIPTTLTYAVRFVPKAEHKFNIDFGIGQVANHIVAGVDLKSRAQAAVGISYAF